MKRRLGENAYHGFIQNCVNDSGRILCQRYGVEDSPSRIIRGEEWRINELLTSEYLKNSKSLKETTVQGTNSRELLYFFP